MALLVLTLVLNSLSIRSMNTADKNQPIFLICAQVYVYISMYTCFVQRRHINVLVLVSVHMLFAHNHCTYKGQHDFFLVKGLLCRFLNFFSTPTQKR